MAKPRKPKHTPIQKSSKTGSFMDRLSKVRKPRIRSGQIIQNSKKEANRKECRSEVKGE